MLPHPPLRHNFEGYSRSVGFALIYEHPLPVDSCRKRFVRHIGGRHHVAFPPRLLLHDLRKVTQLAEGEPLPPPGQSQDAHRHHSPPFATHARTNRRGRHRFFVRRAPVRSHPPRPPDPQERAERPAPGVERLSQRKCRHAACPPPFAKAMPFVIHIALRMALLMGHRPRKPLMQAGWLRRGNGVGLGRTW